MTFDLFPTQEDQVRLAGPETRVTLICTCDMNEVGLFNNREIVGVRPGRSALPRQGEDKFIFTSSINRAQTDSRDRVMVFVGVKKKFLTKIDGSLNGWSCPRGTPMELLKVQHGRPVLKFSR
jgi:hypothetical protein